jgi:hypothetical protein
MKLKLLVMALALSGFAVSGSAANLGELTTQPAIQNLYIPAKDVTFATKYFFSLTDDTTVSAGASSLSLVLGNTPILGIADFNLQLFSSTNLLLATASVLDHTYRIDNVALLADNYYFQVSGETTGLSGGSYAFAAASTTVVPEPASLALFGAGLFAIGLMCTRAAQHEQNPRRRIKSTADLATGGRILS